MIDFRLKVKDGKFSQDPEVQKWLKETEDRLRPELRKFFESNQYNEFFRKQLKDLLIHGRSEYNTKDIEKTIREYFEQKDD